MFYQRFLDLKKHLKQKSCMLLGPRATGKSQWIKHQLKDYLVIDLLNNHFYLQLLQNPNLLEQLIGQHQFVVIDEIQKIPALLDEVHRLIENKGIRFMLTGSSARKLKRGGANLLAGRARHLEFFPLTSQEINDFDLLKYCHTGGMPLVYLSETPWIELRDYVSFYLKEEIQAEALVRRIDAFARFLDTFGLRSGEELNYKSIASDSMVPEKTVANFVEILKDTLLAYELTPYKTPIRKSVTRSKLYFFDVGIANYLAGRKSFEMKSQDFGTAFEHFILQEIRAYISYNLKDEKMQYWRTLDQYEVDCIIGGKIAIEIKSTQNIQNKHIESLKKLKSEVTKITNYYVISLDQSAKNFDGIETIHVNEFLKKLWGHEIF